MRNKTLVEDRLDGSSNFSSWKSRLQITLEEDDLLSVIQNILQKTVIDEEKEEWKEDDVKARKIIIYSVRDHLLPCISNLKKTSYEMHDTLKNMFESTYTLISLTLKNHLQHIKMTKADTVATFFMKISKIKISGVPLEKPYQREKLYLLLSMLFQDIGNHFFKVSMVEKIYLDLIVYGQTAPRKNPNL
jgi:hypothetical protein